MKKYFEKIYKKDFNSFIKELRQRIEREEKSFIITANPETLMIGKEKPVFDEILKSEKTLIVPDGIGVVKAANILGYPLKERITGVEIVEELLKIIDEKKKTIYLFGAKQEVMERFVEKIEQNYQNAKVVGYQNGYVKDKDAVFKEMIALKPDVVLVALGIPMQETLIYKYYDQFSKGIFIGVGGSFDVLSGTKKRAPKIFIKLNLEWLYRIAKEPKRIKRFYNSNVKFITEIKKLR
ncbi:MAG: WecB/TagA/CpsF family glycosyltransferase [Schaedlerella sp.]|nr:WecB/TagA/CpsF family glycosyltransferase [Schaedlerella sp.]